MKHESRSLDYEAYSCLGQSAVDKAGLAWAGLAHAVVSVGLAGLDCSDWTGLDWATGPVGGNPETVLELQAPNEG